MENNNKEYINQLTDNFLSLSCPLGYSDIKIAIKHIIDSGLVPFEYEAPKKLLTIIENFVDETGMDFKNIDICFVVLDYILQYARAEIEAKTGLDIENDYDCWIYANYLCSSFYFNEADKVKFEEKLKKLRIKKEDFSETTNYFFDDCEIEF